MFAFSAAAALTLLAAGTPAEPAALPSGDSAAWRIAMLDWSAQGPQPAGTVPFLMEKPLASGWLSSTFGVRADPVNGSWRAHRGVDIAAPAGAPIVASADGMVSYAGPAGGYGNLVQIDHPGGLQTRYGHLSRIFARTGDVVRRGEVIGAVGSTGHSTGSHLHFEIRRGGLAVDPLRPLPGDPIRLPAAAEAVAPAATPHWQGWSTADDRLPAAYR